MSQIDDRLEALDAEREQLLKLKEAGVVDAKLALNEQVKLVSMHLAEAERLAKSFQLDFSFNAGYKDVRYSARDDNYWSSDDYGWSSSSLSC